MKAIIHLLYVPVPDEDVGERIARSLLEQELIACANLLPAGRSFYRWEGAIADESERLLILKTTEDAVASVREAVEALHPYECPCVLDWPVGAASGFGQWVESQVGGS